MAISFDEMVRKGQTKLRNKADIMASNYDGSKQRAIENFNDLPFGPNTKAAYERGVRNAEYRAPDPDKWARNFRAGASR